MTNSRYVAGRAFEYKVAKQLKEEGWQVIRAAGSHGPYDLVAWSPEVGVRLIQCKIVKDNAAAKRMEEQWLAASDPSPLYKQELMMWIRSEKLIATAEVG